MSFGLILALFGHIFISTLYKQNIKEDILYGASNEAKGINKEFKFYINDFEAKLKAIKESELFHNYYELNDIISMQNYFLDIAKTSNTIMQLRLISLDGNEIIRVDREKASIKPYIVSVDKLQNKHSRYYFNELSKLNNSSFWYSKLDLNIEHNMIQKPLEPVLRIGTPLYIENKMDAILIINVFMKDFLKELRKISFYKVYLIDKDANVILSPKMHESWSKYLDRNDINLPFKDDLNNILTHNEYMGDNFFARKLDLDNGEDIRVVLVPNEAYLSQKMDKSYNQVLFAVLGVIFLSIPLSYFMSISPANLKNKVDELNQKLQDEQIEQKLLLSLFDLSDSVLFKWNNDDLWSVSFASKSVDGLLEYKKEEFESNMLTYASCIHPDDKEHVYKEVNDAIDEKKYFFSHDPYRVITKSGKVKWILDHTVVVRNKNDEITHFLGYLSDITELKNQEIKLKELARRDQLTQIYNRVYLDEMLINQYYRFYRNHEECSVIMIDIDFFKDVNDKYGHLAGDKVLNEFVQILKESIRAGDILGRWGGEEFLLILPHTNIDSAYLLAQKLKNAINKHEFSIVGKKTASFGISSFRRKATVEDILEEVDKALYEAKAAGRNCIKVYKA
jgi:diguanylate cyclase (GGDEF)-like protein/PAS domain S-box-containing protein